MLIDSGRKKPNILLIVQDSARAQNFSLYGYPRKTTPLLEELADQCVVYRNAISAATSTVPSHASMFTGTHVSSHQLFMDKDKLTLRYITMAEFLRDHGYYTYGICYQDDVSPMTGLHRGFNEFHMDDEPGILKAILRTMVRTKSPKRSIQDGAHLMLTKWHRSSERKRLENLINKMRETKFYKKLYWIATRYSDQGAVSSEKKIKRFLHTRDKDQPFFIFLHYDETHIPYRAKVPHRYKFFENGFQGKKPYLVNQDRHKYFLNELDMDEEDFNILKSLYDGTINYIDKKIFELYKYLEKKRLLDDTMIIILGDHGDNIGDHGLMSHKYCVYETLTRVPMIIKYPKYMQLKSDSFQIAQTTDLFPTILDVLDIDNHNILDQVEGNSLLSDKIRNRPKNYAVSELLKPFGLDILQMRQKLIKYDKSLFAARSLKYKYIHSTSKDDEFYDLESDPNELQNLIGTNHPEIINLKNIAKDDLKRFKDCYQKYEHELKA